MTTTEELREQIERKQDEISVVAHKIESRIEEYKDWQTTVRQHPFVMAGAAVGLGLVISGAAWPVLRFAGRQGRVLLKSVVTGYLITLLQNRLQSRMTDV